MTSHRALRIFTNGGNISPEELRKLIQVARLAGCVYITPGARQELYLEVEKKHLITVEKELNKNAITYSLLENKVQNIVTSFAALHILPATIWIFGDTYLDILDSFAYQPRLKINIVDPLQSLVPLFTGELNFLASAYPNYWYLYVQIPTLGKRQVWPLLIDGDDIGTLSKVIEDIYLKESFCSLEELFHRVNENFSGRSRPFEQELVMQDQDFPQIEGKHKTGNSTWLGIYRRNFTFSLDFLEALQGLCVQTKIGKICLTPHKTLLINGIREEDCLQWEKLLGLHGINIRHSALELNWQLPDLDKQALQLKNVLVQALEEKEISTTGLSFAILTQPIDIATSVRIEQDVSVSTVNNSPIYKILHTVDFSVHHTHWIVFAEQVNAQELAHELARLCKVFYQQAGATAPTSVPEETPHLSQPHHLYQCRDCLTVYDPLYGDSWSESVNTVPFHKLPQEYTCSICEAPKTNFILVENLDYIG